VDVDTGVAGAVGSDLGAPVGPRARGVRVGVGVGSDGRAGQAANAANITALTAAMRKTRRLNRAHVFFTLESCIA
jgi:hypothetical protein